MAEPRPGSLAVHVSPSGMPGSLGLPLLEDPAMLPGKGSRNPEGLGVTLLENPDTLTQPELGRAEPGRQGWETLAFPDFWREARI